MRKLVGVAVSALLVALCVADAGSASSPLPTPGTASQVAALVAASTSITKLPKDLVPPLADVSADKPGLYYPSGNNACKGTTQCVYGDKSSKTSIVLFGDSHAQMWLPALVPVALANHIRLVMVWMPGCPAADLSVWDAQTHSIDAACNQFRTSSIKAINKLAPALVLTADRTTDILGPGHKFMSSATWRTGLEATIGDLRTATTKVAVIGDINAFTVSLPACLAAHATAVQKCSSLDPNPKIDQHVAAEMAAATAEGVTYVNPQPWLCTKSCSPVIGNMVAYFDNEHVSATYSEYLSTVFGEALKPLI